METMEPEGDEVTVHVRLLNEGTDVSRPCQAIALGHGIYLLIAPSGYDSEDESLQFPPGSFVRAERKITAAGEYLLATGNVEKSGELIFQLFRQLRKRTRPCSIEDILSARDEGRR
jgi:hypothetical protein